MRLKECIVWQYLLLFTSCCFAKEIKCASGFTSHQRVIAPEHIDDGYCDCPLDGLDEPNTQACSGALKGGWAGIPATHHDGLVFTCPQQPSLLLPVSRLKDGVCDCCDGADEAPGTCKDNCEEVLREERERQEMLQKSFAEGYARRQQELEIFKKEMVKLEKELEEETDKYARVQKELGDAEEAIAVQKKQNLMERIKVVESTISSVTSTLLEPFSDAELAQLIVQSCQLAGEHSQDQDSSSTTCEPLVSAGLDVGIVWEDVNMSEGTATLRRLDTESSEWADLLHEKSVAADNENSSSSHRRLTEEEDDLDDYEDYNDDYMYDEDDYDDRYNDEDAESSSEKVCRNQELEEKIKGHALSAARISFLSRASDVISKIDDLMKEPEEEKKEGDEESPPTDAVDPMAYQMVRSTLRRREQSIQRGLDFAVSAGILVKNVMDSRRDLMALAAGTLFHSKIRSTDLYQIVAYMDTDVPENSCVSPWTILCPPKVTERDGYSFPPSAIVQAGQHYCQDAPTDKAGICATPDPEQLPTSITDGYYGYFVVEPRDENDALSEVFAPLAKFAADHSMTELVSARNALEEKRRTHADRMEELSEQMGGDDHSKFGNEGELYSLRDSCHSVEEGKYTYEVCIFGRAAQKEGQGSGTSLGNWKGMSVDNDTGERILEWTNGQKCWNGPNRSATVHLTCGAEHKLLRAEEPDTCRYVLEMESYIACDDDYKQRHGL